MEVNKLTEIAITQAKCLFKQSNKEVQVNGACWLEIWNEIRNDK